MDFLSFDTLPIRSNSRKQINSFTYLETTTEDDDASDDNGIVSTVSCMNGDFVEMTASINKSDVQNDLTQEGWTLGTV